jgi:glyoxylase-like metal-dependent hydrolase (beta-lactamase superfamily II)
MPPDSTLSGSPAVRPGVSIVDLYYLGEPRSIASALLEGPDGFAIVDPGPSTTLPRLRAAMAEHGAALMDVRAVLLTHIHLDHAGATGTLVRENPDLRVYVHERGAAHVADPSRLLRSATRIYGDRMEYLWGAVLPVPADHLVVLGDRDTLDIGGRRVESMYTPGHAWHHVSYLDSASGTAFVGDTAGERYPGEQYVLPVTPPPDVEVETWIRSLHRLKAWGAGSLAVTHFGTFPDPERHLTEYEQHLRQWATWVKESLAQAGTDDDRAALFAARVEADLADRVPPHVAANYRTSVRSSWDGLARYWRTTQPAPEQ